MSGHSDFYRVNSSFSDAVVSFSLVANQTQAIKFCDRLRFIVSPFTRDNMPLKSFVVIGGFIPSKLYHSVH